MAGQAGLHSPQRHASRQSQGAPRGRALRWALLGCPKPIKSALGEQCCHCVPSRSKEVTVWWPEELDKGPRKVRVELKL